MLKTKSKPKTAAKSAKTPVARMTVPEIMKILEKAGTEQARKTYRRHGAPEPMFGVSFGFLKTLVNKIKIDHELALALWDTGNFDARNLACKVVDPAQMSPADLDKWAVTPYAPMCSPYIANIAAEGPHGRAKVDQWLKSSNETLRQMGWSLVGMLAMLDETMPDAWFLARLGEIEKTIHSAPNRQKAAMNQAVISIGCRNAALRKTVTAAAKRIGKVEVDHGDTSCQTPDAKQYLDKCWARSTGKFESPAAAERARESMRTRC